MQFDDNALGIYTAMSLGEATALFNAECEKLGLSKRELSRRVAALDLDAEREGFALDYAHLKRKLNPNDIYAVSMQDIAPLTMASGVDVFVHWMLARLLDARAVAADPTDFSPAVAASLMAEVQRASADLSAALAQGIGRMDGPTAVACDHTAKGLLRAVGRVLGMVRAHVDGCYRHTPRMEPSTSILFQTPRKRPWWSRMLWR